MKPVPRLKTGLALGAAALALLFGATQGRAADTAANYPSKPIELVVTVTPGNAADLIARLMADIIQKEGWLSQPIVVVNKPGSGGSVAMPYVFEKKGDAHVVMMAGSGAILNTPQRIEVPYNYDSFVPIVNLAVDGEVFVVRADSPYKSIKDVFEAAKKAPETLIQGGGAYAGTDGMIYEILQKVSGAKWNFLSFKGSNPEALLNMMGGSVHMMTPNPNTILDYARTGKVRVLLTMAPERYKEFPDVPTMKELGYSDAIMEWRGFQGAPGMPDFAVKKIAEVFKKVYEHERFRKTVVDEMQMQLAYMDTPAYTKFLGEEYARWTEWLRAVDLLKKK